jgi:hypothetical protein
MYTNFLKKKINIWNAFKTKKRFPGRPPTPENSQNTFFEIGESRSPVLTQISHRSRHVAFSYSICFLLTKMEEHCLFFIMVIINCQQSTLYDRRLYCPSFVVKKISTRYLPPLHLIILSRLFYLIYIYILF